MIGQVQLMAIRDCNTDYRNYYTSCCCIDFTYQPLKTEFKESEQVYRVDVFLQKDDKFIT